MSRVLVFAGSARKDSLNKRLARAVVPVLEEAGLAATFLDLADYPMPIYDGDIEANEGFPAAAVALKERFAEHEGLVIACPEYNSSITPLLKNTIDWLSRPAEGERPLAAFRGKVAGLVAASPGALGGLRGLVTVRSILGNIGVWVAPTQVAVGGAHKALADGLDEVTGKRVGALVAEMASLLQR